MLLHGDVDDGEESRGGSAGGDGLGIFKVYGVFTGRNDIAALA